MGFFYETTDETQVWTITKHNTGYFDEYKEITCTKEWETGTVHTVVPQWEVGTDESLSILAISVDAKERTIGLLIDFAEGSECYEALTIDLAENIYYGTGYIPQW